MNLLRLRPLTLTWLAILGLAVTVRATDVAAAGAKPPPAVPNSECMDCHTDARRATAARKCHR